MTLDPMRSTLAHAENNDRQIAAKDNAKAQFDEDAGWKEIEEANDAAGDPTADPEDITSNDYEQIAEGAAAIGLGERAAYLRAQANQALKDAETIRQEASKLPKQPTLTRFHVGKQQLELAESAEHDFQINCSKCIGHHLSDVPPCPLGSRPYFRGPADVIRFQARLRQGSGKLGKARQLRLRFWCDSDTFLEHIENSR